MRNSQNQHGVHSPFVYDLVTNCFYDKTNYPEYDLIRKYRNELLSDKSEITIKDFGAGSKVFSSNKRPIFSIAKNSGITYYRAKLLYRLVNFLNIENALELGTSLGIASAAISVNQKTKLVTLEGCPNIATIAAKQFEKFALQNIDLRVDTFANTIPEILENHLNFDLIYFDGNHQKQATLDYFEQLLPLAHNNSVFIFDDIHWSAEMEEAWEIIKSHPKISVSIDTYQWGLVFFRKEQLKQHFSIRV
ncbi:class I SAM-dependent methyltransferase [Gramella sp. AN32]|uniref:O-methyltransferase n=1 Tax=Christiangramia antarctica TaxID=2058158 RepID=A0ABW5X4U5_9FLAO